MNAVKFVLLALVCAAYASRLEEEFDMWAMEYGKTYESEEEREYRMQVYFENKEKIAKLNAESTSEEYGVNAFTDQTMEELVRTYTVSMPAPEEFGLEVEEYVPPTNISAVPASFDWASRGAVTSVKNQGNCGSCWAFSACGCMEGQLAIKKHKLMDLSPQMLVDCDHDCITFGSKKLCDNACDGGLPAMAFQHVIKTGINSLKEYAYVGKKESCKYKSSTAVKGFHHWSQVKVNHEDDLRAYVQNNGPVAVLIHAEELFHYKSGVFSGNCVQQYDHAVLLTGWGQDEKGTPYWIIKNSWGKDWGMKGYVHLIRNKNKCGLLTFMTMVHV